MAFSRALLIKGLAGVTAVGAVGIGGYGIMHPNKFKDFFKSQSQINDEKNKKTKEVNEKLKTLGLAENDCKLETTDFSSSSEYSKDCVLDKDKFQKIKFFDGDQATGTVDGWTDEKTITLTISDKSDGGIKFLFSGHPTNLTISKTGGQEKVTIKKEIKTEFKEENGRLVKVIDQAFKAKLETINGKLNTLGLTDESCRFDVSEREETLECGLDEGKLKTLKFSNKGDTEDLTVNGTVGNDLKIKVEVGNGNDPSFSFSGLTQDLTLYGDKSKGKIVLRQGGEGRFRLVGDRLTKESPKEALKKFNEQLGTINAPIECRFDEAENEESVECDITEDKFKELGFSNKGEGNLTVKTWPTSTVKLKVEKDSASKDEMSISFTGVTSEVKVFGDKSKGKIVVKNDKKFKVEGDKLTKSAVVDQTLKNFNDQLIKVNAPVECRFDETEAETSVECGITEDEFKTLNFSNKGTGDHKVVGWNGNTNVKLKAEKGTQNEMSVTFTGVTSEIKVFGDKNKGKIVVKPSSPEKKFKVQDGKLTKGTSDADLKKFNDELGKVNAPIECRFDESETETTVTVECAVSKEDLKKIIFTKDQGVLSYSSGNDSFTGMKMVIQAQKEITHSGYATQGKVMHLAFKDNDKTVKLMEGSKEVISFAKGTNPEFGIYTADESDVHVMEKVWRSSDFVGKLSLQCTPKAGKTYEECKSTINSVSMGKGTGDDFETLTLSSPSSDKFELYKNQENYNQGFKFVFKGTTVSGKNGSHDLVDNGCYEFKWKHQSSTKVGYLVKKEGG